VKACKELKRNSIYRPNKYPMMVGTHSVHDFSNFIIIFIDDRLPAVGPAVGTAMGDALGIAVGVLDGVIVGAEVGLYDGPDAIKVARN
jgi:hypothetical protein